MAGSLAPIAALLASVTILLMGNGLQGTLLPLRADSARFSEAQIGIMGGAYFAGFILGCLLGSRIVRRVGHIRAYIAMSATATAVVLIHSLFVAVIYAITAAVAVLRMKARARPAPEALEPFVATAAGVAPAVFELDPRAPEAGAAAEDEGTTEAQRR